MTTSTSKKAYREIADTLGQRQAEVLAVFYYKKAKDYTNTELANILGLPINCVTPRVFELRGKGTIGYSQKRVCNITGKQVYAWKLK